MIYQDLGSLMGLLGREQLGFWFNRSQITDYPGFILDPWQSRTDSYQEKFILTAKG